MRTPVALLKFTHRKARTAAALSGVCFSILLMYMQLGFYDSCFRSSTMVFDQLDFDIALVSPQYVHVRFAGTIPRRRLAQAKAVPGVAGAVPFYVGGGTWRNPQTKVQLEILVLGVDPMRQPFRLPDLAAKVAKLKKRDTAIMDTTALEGYGAVQPGTVSELENRRVEVVDTYAYGSGGFISDAEIVVSDRTLSRLLDGYSLGEVSLGLVRVKPGSDPVAVARDLRAALPADVRVVRRPELEAEEQHFFVRVKAIGIMFTCGVILAFAVGAVILYQIQATEIVNHLREYALLKAIGYSRAYISLLVLKQGALLALLGFLPATLLACGLYALIRSVAHVPTVMTWPRVALVLVLSVSMCSLSGLLVSRKVGRADPADLF